MEIKNESYSASIQGRQDIDIYPQISGTITELRVYEGKTVRKGEVMFVIDQVPYRAAWRKTMADVHAAEAQVETARLEYRSKQQLFAEKVVSEYDLSTAKNALAIAEATLEQARALEEDARNSLSYTEVKILVSEWSCSAHYLTGRAHWLQRFDSYSVNIPVSRQIQRCMLRLILLQHKREDKVKIVVSQRQIPFFHPKKYRQKPERLAVALY